VSIWEKPSWTFNRSSGSVSDWMDAPQIKLLKETSLVTGTAGKESFYYRDQAFKEFNHFLPPSNNQGHAANGSNQLGDIHVTGLSRYTQDRHMHLRSKDNWHSYSCGIYKAQFQ
jgi:hypothetical protein